eukprot:5180285-Amphidinium_carterae.4
MEVGRLRQGYERWAAGDWDLSPSPSPVREPSRSRSESPAESSSRRAVMLSVALAQGRVCFSCQERLIRKT